MTPCVSMYASELIHVVLVTKPINSIPDNMKPTKAPIHFTCSINMLYDQEGKRLYITDENTEAITISFYNNMNQYVSSVELDLTANTQYEFSVENLATGEYTIIITTNQSDYEGHIEI